MFQNSSCSHLVLTNIYVRNVVGTSDARAVRTPVTNHPATFADSMPWKTAPIARVENMYTKRTTRRSRVWKLEPALRMKIDVHGCLFRRPNFHTLHVFCACGTQKRNPQENQAHKINAIRSSCTLREEAIVRAHMIQIMLFERQEMHRCMEGRICAELKRSAKSYCAYTITLSG